ncbi:MAG: hypothetical protein K8F52_06810 [Candidatus Scalindua rubra]|uniref:Uncharacterized protein n=1 Tax=Candidatus Scalindua brodae TaxID=237368 RepID=A0A0B0EJE9_9BACT|nr:MAG: hypothetical protein SCABRO_03436 [Candidatus Scalindua brodae]MBZ0108362.1 hypothetical protein [Candidatus Scalindua rubra]TWU34060.1 hypothetical protein S225a_13170 [Candidatus Brocadiaceae bacterium S225]
MINATSFASQNWVITPTAMADCVSPQVFEDPSKKTPVKQPVPGCKNQWLLVLSGVVHLGLKGGNGWVREDVKIFPDIQAPMNYVINRNSILVPNEPHQKDFQVDQWAPHASLSSMLNLEHSVNSGFAVDSWRPSPFRTETDFVVGGAPFGNLFDGILVNVAVRDIDAILYRLSYHITLIGTIRYRAQSVID